MGYTRGLPKDEAEREQRREGVRESFKRRSARTADTYRDKLIELYGEERGKQVKYAEAFEICEYGRRPSGEEIKRLFPFFGEAEGWRAAENAESTALEGSG